ncbi:hypothetical protein BSF40_21380 [Pseudomonas sp. ACN5]|nr:hypothetical protein BSF40_21380 [Pseudomonas sp. ACN5]
MPVPKASRTDLTSNSSQRLVAADQSEIFAFGGVDYRQADTVFDRTAGVLRFELEEQRAKAGNAAVRTISTRR